MKVYDDVFLNASWYGIFKVLATVTGIVFMLGVFAGWQLRNCFRGSSANYNCGGDASALQKDVRKEEKMRKGLSEPEKEEGKRKNRSVKVQSQTTCTELRGAAAPRFLLTWFDQGGWSDSDFEWLRAILN